MSAALKAAIAAQRAALAKVKLSDDAAAAAAAASSSSSSAAQEEDEDALTNTRRGGSERRREQEETQLAQASTESLLLKSTQTGRLILASRAPPLTELPPSAIQLLDDDAPQWYRQHANTAAGRRPWYERADLVQLSLSNNIIKSIPNAIQGFAALSRLDLHNNALKNVPDALSGLCQLTHLNLRGNNLSIFPTSLLMHPTLLELDLSSNRITTLWDQRDLEASVKEYEEIIAASAEAMETGGIWAGLGDSSRSSKKYKPDPQRPLPACRFLSLGNNRLTNASLRWSLVSPEGAQAEAQTERQQAIIWPTNLTTLDVSDNFVRGPIPLAAFGTLSSLQHLDLGGNGLASDIFEANAPEIEGSLPTAEPAKFFPSLTLLSLYRCEMDDLEPLEEVWGSPRTIAEGEKAFPAGVGTPQPRVGIQARQLVSVRSRIPERIPKGQLAIVLEGNPLREEAYRRKKAPVSGLRPMDARQGASGLRSVSNEVMRSAEGGAPAPAKRQDEIEEGDRTDYLADERFTKAATATFAPSVGESVQTGTRNLDVQLPSGRGTRRREVDLDEWGPLGGSTSLPARAKVKAKVPDAKDTQGHPIVARQTERAPANQSEWGPLGGAGATARCQGAASATRQRTEDGQAALKPLQEPSYAATPPGTTVRGPATEVWEQSLSEGAKRRLRAQAAREAAQGGQSESALPNPQIDFSSPQASDRTPPKSASGTTTLETQGAGTPRSRGKRGAAPWESSIQL
ncbi:L domain-like protein [Ceraceosorus guamensis]|uniref:L domain-like protein n=1 Tax=Ceraceosorus guamensis TaxID=1522189 RepID=A0A316W2N3_9BASI|nr:L domain-like protein [Ceraceosorus guamensis]PWN43043.1 L domain-like protein [Ceraceosorus guamensis]